MFQVFLPPFTNFYTLKKLSKACELTKSIMPESVCDVMIESVYIALTIVIYINRQIV